MANEQTYTITELAREFEVTPRAIRFYEDQGLLAPARSGMNRIYSRADRTRLKLTLRGRRLGLTLAQIKELMSLYGRSLEDSAAQTRGFLMVLAERRAALERQREDIEAVLAEISLLERQCSELLQHNPAGAAEAKAQLAERMRKEG